MAKKKLLIDRGVLDAHVKSEAEGLVIVIKVKPGASTEKIEINAASEVVLSVRAAAVEGAANERVRELLAAVFGTAKSRVVIMQGEHSRVKKILIRH